MHKENIKTIPFPEFPKLSVYALVETDLVPHVLARAVVDMVN